MKSGSLRTDQREALRLQHHPQVTALEQLPLLHPWYPLSHLRRHYPRSRSILHQNPVLYVSFPPGSTKPFWNDIIGTKEENPEEARVDFHEELSQAEQTEFDFRGVAGAVATAASVKTVATPETGSQPTETKTDSPEVEMEELLSDDGDYMADKIQVTPVQQTQVRQSQKISGKKFKFAETSPENSSGQSELVKTIHLMKKMETCVGI
ncbi:hypothetical protein F2Q68_00015452 [Brassica cretica]|uniref:Uncharacterized protein n=2 Tax=Brassica cretica TaxID=69181 RepID=A0ABQ7FA09_BRACR|nr:hypothetical protein F2Q68_00015452 [Brassica cretica]KAF3612018.1 hypothetical protein DY000_02048083 [Brassica cretica]